MTHTRIIKAHFIFIILKDINMYFCINTKTSLHKEKKIKNIKLIVRDFFM